MKKLIYLVAVLFAGTALTAIVSCSENDEWADYWLLKHIVDNKDIISPIPVVNSSITEFFETEWPSGPNHRHGYFYDYVDSTTSIWVTGPDTICDLINSQEQLQAVYFGDKTLPEINFTKYTLLIGRVEVSDSGHSIQKIDLVQTTNGLMANVYIQKSQSGLVFPAFTYLRFWRLYPKLASTDITINVIKSK